VTLVHRVLFPKPINSFDEYLKRRGGRGIEAARQLEPAALIDTIRLAGLRGRGGAGFPTAIKWQTTVDNASEELPPTVVINGAEGEPGTFKDRSIVRADPYVVIEGALIAARAVSADSIVFGLKKAFAEEVTRIRGAVDEIEAAGWTDGVTIKVVEGPDEYLYGEETALLEVIDGRYPFPRIAPPYRRGVREVWLDLDDVTADSGLPAHLQLAGPTDETVAPPALVENVETLANVPSIIARGPEWFRNDGTKESPGTIVCTVTGSTMRDDVGEVMMGTPLREVIETIGGGVDIGRSIKAVAAGVSNPIMTGDQLDTPCSYEGMMAAGTGLGTGGFLVFDDTVDMAAVAAGAARFLAVESCGQCVPCKLDGIALADHLARICRNEANEADLAGVHRRLSTIENGARCFLPTQQQALVGSIVEKFGDELEAHVKREVDPVEPYLITELLDIDGYEAVVDLRFRTKQPDWTHGDHWDGSVPAERLDDHRAPKPVDD
jgi:NADH:ubiquinone oxidoreductase subunit F (NADH-binding)